LKLDTERRRHKRFKYEAVISHDVSTNGNVYPGKMFNFSKDGLYFESDQAIYPDEDIFVALAIHADASGKDTQLLLEAIIIWQKETENSALCYGYGGKFLSTYDSFTDTGQIQEKIIEKKTSSSYVLGEGNDSRKHKRRPYHKSLLFSCDRHEHKGLVSNIGRGGTFILTKENFVLGSQVKLVVPAVKSRKEIKETGWIVRISLEGIGISFERRSGRERRYDLDRRTGLERRGRKKRLRS
jgi:Tfp pilus assembly protein PilZ